MSSSDPGLTPPPTPPLTPPGRRPEGKGAGNSKTFIAVILGLAVLCALAAAVVWWLPDIADNQSGKSPANSKAATEEAPSSSINTGPLQPEQAETARQQAVEAEQLWLEKKAEAELSNMGAWGGDEYAGAVKLSEQARELFKKENFADSTDLFQKASAQIDAIEASKPRILEKALEQGASALEKGSRDEAEQAFAIALAIDPANSKAQTGLRRAATIVRVHSMLKDARDSMDAGQPEEALKILKEALKIDPACTKAEELMEQARGMVRRKKYDSAMGRAISALAAGKYAESDRALQQARSLFPSDPAVAELAVRLKEARTASAIRVLLKDAGNAVTQEEWQKAIDLYKKALAEDPLSVAAREGLARSEKRLALQKALEKIITNPWHLNEKGPFQDAQNTLRLAEAVRDQGPKLQRLTASAREVLRQSRQKINVTFISDNMTDVVVYHVGRLGRFSKRTLKLKPGIYTVKGMREGYRDVLKQVRIRPGVGGVEVDIRCEGRI